MSVALLYHRIIVIAVVQGLFMNVSFMIRDICYNLLFCLNLEMGSCV
jgi:hypothetical protein